MWTALCSKLASVKLDTPLNVSPNLILPLLAFLVLYGWWVEESSGFFMQPVTTNKLKLRGRNTTYKSKFESK